MNFIKKRSSLPLTPTTLKKGAAKTIADTINPLVADAFALFVKTKNFHWHISGHHYRDYHLLLDEQAAQIFATIDVLAERVRKTSGTTIRSINHISRLQTINDDDEPFVEPIEMLRRLMNDNKQMASRMRKAHKICDEFEDIATASLLETFVDEAEHRVWFLFETIQNY